ncbi:MAG TPA: response regulator [Gemmatimonadales bacterium]
MLEPAKPSVLCLARHDDSTIRNGIVPYLMSRGCDVAVTVDGLEALDALEKKRYDVVLADLELPDRDGLWLWYEAVRREPGLEGRFILSGSDPRAYGLDGLVKERFLTKPLGTTEVWREVLGIVGRV